MSANPGPAGGQAPLESVGVLADRRQLRDFLSAFATGVTVVTVGGANPHGMTANAFTSLSLDPPLVLICVNHNARLHQALVPAGGFGVSVLASHQQEIARYFSHGERPQGYAQFASVSWMPGQRTGAPLINGALAWFECTLDEIYGGGDHSIFVGRLVSMAHREQGWPLVFHRGRFHQLGGEVRDDNASR